MTRHSSLRGVLRQDTKAATVSRGSGEKSSPALQGTQCSGKVTQDVDALCSALSSKQARLCTEEGGHLKGHRMVWGEGDHLASPSCPRFLTHGLASPGKGVTIVKAGFLTSSRMSFLHQKIAQR